MRMRMIEHVVFRLKTVVNYCTVKVKKLLLRPLFYEGGTKLIAKWFKKLEKSYGLSVFLQAKIVCMSAN